ncbi:AraC family transcriptional regulator [Cohnella endophytica]|uniref:AraC family transcriptional regulator n=1 Tax=Cohnella endophytica TaxID=2419778 RepID=A0A494Y3I9_9BACL|nr:AraC family transcriptional regulator [Cohnella endophytica]RKP57229.1 AraC family transcriptional regulator [Cohnella endophytica]
MNKLSFPNVTEKDVHLPLYLTSIGHWDHQERTRRPEGFPDYQWLQADSGGGELIVGDKRSPVKPGQGFFLFPREVHLYQPVGENWGVHWMSFNGGLVPSLLQQAGIARSGVFTLSNPERMIAHLERIHTMSLARNPFLGMECSKLLYAFLLDLMKSVWTDSPSADHNLTKLHPVIRFIESNCHRPLTIDEMADTIDVSVQHLCHLFKTGLKMRPMEYVNRERINKSKQWMFREPDAKIRDIAERVGFDNPSYFSSVFRKLEGLSPEQFKGSHGRNG